MNITLEHININCINEYLHLLYCVEWNIRLHHYLHIDSVEYQAQPRAKQDVVTVLHDTVIM